MNRAVVILVPLLLISACRRPDVDKKVDELEKKLGDELAKNLKAELAKGPKWVLIDQWSPGPVKDPTQDQLFPPKVAAFERAKTETKATLPDLGLKEAGEHAVYADGKMHVDVFAFRIDLEENRRLRGAVEKKRTTNDYAYSDFGAGGDIWNGCYRTKDNQQGIYWCNKTWFFFVRSADVENVGTFLDAYVDAVFVEGHGKK